MKYKNYLFDCGNVLFTFSKTLLLNKYVEKEEDKPIVRDVLFNYWEMQDKGMDTEKFYEFIKTKLPERLHESCYNICFHWDKWITPFKDMEELIIKLKARGHKLYLLSNMPSTFTKDHSALPLLDILDGLYFSYNAKIVKPDPKIFKMCIKEYDLDVKTTIFIDDSKANCETANSLGLDTFIFDENNRDEFINYIKNIEDIK